MIYESNVETTIGPVCWRDGADAVQLVQTLPQGTRADGAETWHEGAAAAHREMDCREVLY